ncbi:MAG: FGGY-family carbohydrate kinase, partial [Spirochaeta sp.]|nr:FGGY-family carbohydrate kinase [Spirochaeta sp.]
LVIDSYFSASKLQWLLENVPACRHAADAGSLMAGTIDTWLVWNFTDHKVFATDYSNASRTLLFNIHTLRWDERLLELFRLPQSLGLPDVRHADDGFGRYRFRQSGRTVPVVGLMGDSHAALYGHTGFAEGDAKTTFGTGSSVMMNVGHEIRRPAPGIVTSIGWGTRGAITYVYEGNIHHTGDTVRWARDQLRLFRDFDEAERRAIAVGDTEGVYLVPAFSGLGAPHWAHGIRAAITGMARSTTADHIIRAALESIAYQVVDVLSAMNAGTDSDLATLMVDGGPSRNSFVMQLLSDLLGVPVRVAEIEEVSARGVAFVAGLASGFWNDEAELRECVRPHKVFAPMMKQTRRHALLEGWQTAVEQVLAGKRSEN